MDLSVLLNSLPDGEVIYIGCKAGSGFFFIGTKEEFQDSESDIIETTKNHYANLCGDCVSTLRSYENGEVFNAYAKRIKTALKRIADPANEYKREEYVEAIVQAANKINGIPGEINRIKGKLHTYEDAYDSANCTTIQNYTVLDTYKRKSVKPYGTIILIEYNGFGSYWLESEYRNRETITAEEVNEA